MQEEGVSIDYISGTSSGSIVASMYACGYTTTEMYNIFKKYARNIKYFDSRNVFKFVKDLVLHRDIMVSGLNSGNSIYYLAKDITNAKGIKTIDEVQMPLLIPAVNIKTEDLYVFYSKSISGLGNSKIKYINDIELAGAIRASCSYPRYIFTI